MAAEMFFITPTMDMSLHLASIILLMCDSLVVRVCDMFLYSCINIYISFSISVRKRDRLKISVWEPG